MAEDDRRGEGVDGFPLVSIGFGGIARRDLPVMDPWWSLAVSRSLCVCVCGGCRQLDRRPGRRKRQEKIAI